MNKKKSPAVATPDGNDRQAVLGVAKSLVSEFERLLNSERDLLKLGQADGLQAIADAKQVLISQLAAIEPSLIFLFSESGSDPDVQNLKDSLEKCRSNNRSNHDLVLLELKYTSKSLELLRSVLKMDDLALYGHRGEVDMKREKRRFGSA